MAGYLAIVIAGSIIIVLLSFLEPSYLLVMAPMALFAFGIALVMPVMTSAGMAPFPGMAGAASALMGFFQMGGGLVGGAIAALMGDPLVAFATLIPTMGFIATGSFCFGGVCRMQLDGRTKSVRHCLEGLDFVDDQAHITPAAEFLRQHFQPEFYSLMPSDSHSRLFQPSRQFVI